MVCALGSCGVACLLYLLLFLEYVFVCHFFPRSLENRGSFVLSGLGSFLPSFSSPSLSLSSYLVPES